MLVGERVVAVYNHGSQTVEQRGEFPFGQDGLDAFVQWWNESNCIVMATTASGFRSLGLSGIANHQTAKSKEYGCNADGAFIGFGKELPDFAFTGGQCSNKNYNVTINWETNVQFFEQPPGSTLGGSHGNLAGPILGTSYNPDSQRWAIVYDGGNQLFNLNLFGGNRAGSNCRVVSVVTSDGTPDDCGDNPEFVPQYQVPDDAPPSPGLGAVIRGAQDVVIQSDYGDGLEDIAFELSDLVFAGARGLTTAINGIPLRMSGDGVIYASDPDPADGEETSSAEESLEEIQEEIKTPVEGDLVVPICDGDDLTVPYMGDGIDGLANLIVASTAAITAQLEALCACNDSGVTLSPRTQLSQGTFDVGDVFVLPLPAKTRFVEIVVSGDEGAVRITKLAGSQREGTFGFYSLGHSGAGGDHFYEPRKVFLLQTVVAIPVEPREVDRLRLSLTRGLDYNCFVYTEVD